MMSWWVHLLVALGCLVWFLQYAMTTTCGRRPLVHGCFPLLALTVSWSLLVLKSLIIVIEWMVP